LFDGRLILAIIESRLFEVKVQAQKSSARLLNYRLVKFTITFLQSVFAWYLDIEEVTANSLQVADDEYVNEAHDCEGLIGEAALLILTH